MASLQDIATKVGVSKGTVSLVLSGKAGKRVSATTREAVIQAAREMNYQINEVARSLRTGRTKIIGVIVTDISNEFFGSLTLYIQQEAKKYGYLVITANSNENTLELNDIVNLLINKKVDGLIVVPTVNGQKILQNILDKGIPLVQVDRYYKGIDADYVGVNNYGTSVNAIQNLITIGCRRIGMICYDLNLNVLKERRQAYIDVLKNNQMLDMTLVKDIQYDEQENQIKDAVIQLLGGENRVDAVFFCSRRVFITAIKYINFFGIQLNKNQHLVCFDEVEGLLSSQGKIHFIKQPIQELAIKSLHLLIDKINGSKDCGNYLFEARETTPGDQRNS